MTIDTSGTWTFNLSGSLTTAITSNPIVIEPDDDEDEDEEDDEDEGYNEWDEPDVPSRETLMKEKLMQIKKLIDEKHDTKG